MRIKIFTTAIAAALMFAAAQATAGPIGFYWTNGWTSPSNSGGGPNGTVNRIDANGANAQTIATLDASGQPLFRVTDVEIDQGRGRIYWNNWNSGATNSSANEAIYRANLNGSGQAVHSSSATTQSGFASGLHRIAVDSRNGDVYWTRGVSYANSPSGPEISKVDVNGANYTKLFGTGTNGWFTSGIAIDEVNSMVYWGDSGVVNRPPNGALNSMSTTGVGPTLLVPWGSGNGQGRSVALDMSAGASGTAFFSAWTTAGGVLNGPANGGGGIWSFDIATGLVSQILNAPNTGIPDIEVDAAGKRIYWTDYVAGTIMSSDYSGGNVMTEISGLLNPFGLALQLAAVPEPASILLFGLGLLGLGFARRPKN